MSGFKRGRVVAVHPEDYSCDIILLADGSRLPGVQIQSMSASTNTGLSDLAKMAPAPGGDQWNASQKTGRDIIAIVGWCDGSPFVNGFLFPQICQMTFAEANRKVDRHASDFYHTVDGAGNAEWFHPSGTYLRMGTPEHEDLTGKDFDGKWKIANNTASTPHVQLVVANAGAAKCTVNIDPEGNVTITSAAGWATHEFPAGMTFDTPLANFTGVLKVATGASGSFTTPTGTTVQVQDGIVTNIF